MKLRGLEPAVSLESSAERNPPKPRSMGRRRMKRNALLLTVIVLIAGAFRFAFLSWGLPRLYQEDEAFFVQPALRVASGNLDPGWFGAPGQTIINPLGIVFRGTSALVNVTHGVHQSVAQNYQQYITLFQTAGRAWPALVGTLSILLVYWIGKNWSRRAGFFSATLCALSFYLVDQSHIIRPDVVQMLFVLAGITALFRLLDQPKRMRWYVLAGMFFGFGITTKYPTLFFVPTIGLVALVLWRRRQWNFRSWRWGVYSAILASFVSGPYLFLDPLKAAHDLIAENPTSHAGHDGLTFFGNLWWYVGRVLTWEYGTILYGIIVATAVTTMVLLLRHRNGQRITKLGILVFAAVSYLALLSILKLHWERWLIPVVYVGFLIAGIGLDTALARFRKYRIAILLLMIVMMVAPLFRLARTVYGYAHPGTVEQARTWIVQSVPRGTRLVEEPYAPELPTDSYQAIQIPNMTVHESSWYREHGIHTYIVMENIYGRIVSEASLPHPKTGFVQAVPKYDALFQQSTLQKEFRVNAHWTADQLLYSNDWNVLQTPHLDLLRGPYVIPSLTNSF